ncbi:URC4/urg3 family protein [Mycolicibacterium aubagnense]
MTTGIGTGTDSAVAVGILRSTAASRAPQNSCWVGHGGGARWFVVDDDSLAGAADLVADVTRTRYPDLVIPYHSRWRHFEAGGVDRNTELRARLSALGVPAQARAMIDLAVVSVLLDAGAGAQWGYVEPTTGQRFTRSEGLGVASWHALCRRHVLQRPGPAVAGRCRGTARR